MIKGRSSKRKYDHIIFEEPLINISMEPTEEVDPLFIDPTAESLNDEGIDDFTINGFSIFSPKVGDFKQKISITPVKKLPNVKVKKEIDTDSSVKIKQEPSEFEDDFDMNFEQQFEQEEETDPVEALAQALKQVEYLCPKCIFRSTEKDQVSHHLMTSHRVFQIGIPRPCDKCDYVAKTVRELSAHKKEKHPRTIIQDNFPVLPTGEVKCPHCEFTSFHKNNVRSHVRIHTQDTVYTCDKCPYTATTRMNIENHAARHLLKPKNRKKWKYKCKHCGLLERSEKLLERHLILHGEGEMLKCQLCPYKSPYNHIISMHTRICHGIVTSKSWEREEKFKNRRKSSRSCARDKKNYNEEKVEDFFEVPLRKRNTRRKSDCKQDEVKPEQDLKQVSNEESKSEESITRRPTLEERLGRARDLISNTLLKKKDKENEEGNKNQTKPKDKEENESFESGEDISDENSDNNSEDEEDKSEDEWSEEESEFDAGTAEESMQSSTSDRQTVDSTAKDNENSITDSEHFKSDTINSKMQQSLVDKDNSNDSFKSKKSNNSKSSNKILDDEPLNKKIKKDLQELPDDNESKTDEKDETKNEEDSEDSVPAVLVLKRTGASFTSFLKNNSESC